MQAFIVTEQNKLLHQYIVLGTAGEMDRGEKPLLQIPNAVFLYSCLKMGNWLGLPNDQGTDGSVNVF